MIILILPSCAFILAILFTMLVKFIAEKLNFYDIPQNGLKKHARPIPYTGLSIWLCFMLVLLGVRLFTSFETGTLHQLRGIVYGGSIILILGLLDDIFELDFKVKFFWQIIAAILLVHYDIYVKIFPVKYLNVAVSLFWVILVMNAVNIIDVMDGLAVGISGICALGFFVITLPTEKTYVNLAAIILFGTLAGFWIFNKPPAKVFMGDAGSLFTGYVLAALSMGADYSRVNIIGLFSPFLILGIPIYDTILVSYFRWRRGQPIFKGSKDHYALRLSSLGFTEWQVDLISYAVSIVLVSAAFAITVFSAGYAFLVLVLVFVLCLMGSAVLNSADPHRE